MSNNPFMPQMSSPAATTGPATMPGQNVSANDAFEVDLNGIEQSGYVIPDGKYRIKCKDVEQSISQSGNPMFIWSFEVSDGPNKGFEIKYFTAITPAAMWKVAEVVVALGIGQTGAVVKFKRSDVIGKECGAVIEQDEYKGNIRSSISRVMNVSELNQ